jgi:transketolase
VKATKENLNWPLQPTFFVPDEVKKLFQSRILDLKAEYEEWQKKYQKWTDNNPKLSNKLKDMLTRSIPNALSSELVQQIPEKWMATRASSGIMIQTAAQFVPGLVGGSADLAPSTKTIINDSNSISAHHFEGRNFHFGIREHGMGSILNGIAEYGGFIPYGATFLVFSDYMRPAIRLAALMKLQVIYVFTHDSIFVGEDGPTHQPVEHVAALRSIPNLVVFRPADTLEVAMAWVYAIKRKQGPTALILTRQTVANFDREKNFDSADIHKGGYILSMEKNTHPDVVLAASGSELQTVMDTKKILESENLSVRVVSIPSLDCFLSQSPEYQDEIVPKTGSQVVVVEAGISQGWDSISHIPILKICMDRFGESAPYHILAQKFGFTGEQVADKVRAWIGGR